MPRRTPRKDTLIRRYQAQFERFTATTASPATADRYSRALEAFLGYFEGEGKAEPADFNKMDVQDFRAYRRKKGISASGTNYEVQVIRRFWNWMIDSEVATINPASAVRKLREEEPVRARLEETQQQELYDVCLDDRERLLVGLALTTGLRGKSLSLLEKSDFHQEEKGFWLQLGGNKMKTHTALRLPIREREWVLIQALPDGGLWDGWAKDTRAVIHKFNKLLRRAGIQLRGIRTARRTVATTLLRNGADIKLVSGWLGHRKLATTFKYTTPATPEEQMAALDVLPGG